MPARHASIARKLVLLGVAGLAAGQAGCFKLPKFFRRDEAPIVRAADRGDHDMSSSKLNGDLDAAKALFEKQEYGAAARKFEYIADNTENSAAVAEEALYYQAESDRLREKLTSAESTYKKLLHDFPSGAYKQQACQRLYDIAVYWLKDTDAEMGQYTEKLDGKRTFVMPASLRINLDKTKPTFDAENRALQALEVVHYSDMQGPLADKAIFLAGYIKFYREDYEEADHFFTALLQFHKDSELAPRACKLAIICKTLANGGAAYDARKVAEARQLVDTALAAYPELTKDEAGRTEMMEHLSAVTAAQADKELHRAEFYERTKHPGSAYYIYEIMRRRYPNSKYERIAIERMEKLRPLMEKAQRGEVEMNVLDRARARWLKLWGLQDDDHRGSLGASPQALPAGIAPGQ